MQRILFAQCDELDIIYYAKDSFVFKNFDTTSVKHFIELITFQNDPSLADCEVNGRLIFKEKGQQLFAAEISSKQVNDSTKCNYIRYTLDAKEYRHLLTYQTGMGMDQIYWHRIDPQHDPWSGFDSSKFYYEDLKNYH